MTDYEEPAHNPAAYPPVPSDAPTEDRIGTAVLAMAAGASASVAWFAGLTFIQLRLVTQSTVTDVGQLDPHSFDVNFMVYGSLLGMVFAAIVAWSLMFAIPSNYRRGGLSIVATFAGTVIAGVLTYLARAVAGPVALLLLGILGGIVAIAFGRRAVQSVT